MSKYCVIGRHGFIGGALAQRLGDVTSYPTKDTKVLFHFASHTHPVFDLNPEYEMKQVMQSFIDLIPYCKEHGILFVYSSSALVYEKETQFARFKKTLESMAQCYDTGSLGLRIFPTYGPGESRTVISQWCEQMAKGEQPVVYGNGTQERDFIHIDDAVSQILLAVTERPQWQWKPRIVDIGAGKPVSFNHVIATINELLMSDIEPKNIEAPVNYSAGVVCPNPMPTRISIKEGMRGILGTKRGILTAPAEYAIQ